MAREFPDWVDPWKAAEGHRIFGGSIPLGAMNRLSPLLANTEGEAEFTVRFSLDGQRRVQVDIDVEAELPLVCQVSLEEYRHRIRRTSRLTVVETQAEQQDLPEGTEGTCTEDGRLKMAHLVEDECLLALPQVPRKPGLEFEGFSTGGDEAAVRRTNKPFAELGEMLKTRRTDQDSGNS
jgi:uncharacterized protein